MGLFDKLRNEFIDIIEFIDNSNNIIVARFERFQNEIKNNAKLIVREGQQAVFINEGKIADIFNPGTYTLNTQNLPILSTLQGWKYGFNSPFKAEVYFINTRNFIDQKWGTKNAITLNDDRFGMLEIRAFGTYTFKITDAGKFIKEIVGTDGQFTTEEIVEQLKSIIVSRFTDAIGEANMPVESYAANLNELSMAIFSYMKDDFASYGMEVSKFLLENVSMPEEIKKEIFELSRLNKIDFNKLTQYKAAKAIELAANNPSGIAGAGVGMGAGLAMGNQMGQAFNQSQPAQTFNTAQNQQIPPPLPVEAKYFIALNNQQSGPFSLIQLIEMTKTGQLTKETLVWSHGMTGWENAETVTELQNIFTQTPPPLPGN
ncbi:SPFH domain-containing protein [Flavobacterium cerinum]|uniref:SPFH domain-containing protein n=1 Tax=Flavobacterium cerinum TaxID=2502784 RepID=A0A444HAK8_9FLAO|nr:SPFH domain-containing protein [Flavobacterium cerinum]RWX00328.1 SPFH domain-containing protein [Flavobacterium cerinum]